MALMKRWGINLGVIVVSVLLTIIILEGVSRFLPISSEPGIGRPYPVPRYYYKPDKESGYDIQENFPKTPLMVDYYYKYQIWSNELGCFDKPHTSHPFILVLGDSFTHGRVSHGDNWCSVVKTRLDYHLLKCGVPGYGTKAELIKAKRILKKVQRYQQIIILGYFLNDMDDDYLCPGVTVIDGYLVANKRLEKRTSKISPISESEIRGKIEKQHSLRKKIDNWVAEQSVLFNMLNNSIKKIKFIKKAFREEPELENWPMSFYRLDKFPWLRGVWAAHLENLRAFKQLAGEHGAKLLVVIIPTKEQVYPFLLKGNVGDSLSLEQPNRMVREFLATENIPCLDLLPLFRQYADQKQRRWLDPEKDLYWRQDTHWNVRGNLLAGFLVGQFILERDLIDMKDKEKRLAAINEELEKLRPKN